MASRVWLQGLLLLAALPFLQVARAQLEEEAATDEVVSGTNLGIIGDDTRISKDGPLNSAPGMETVCVSPQNASKIAVVPAGEETELLISLQNDGESALNAVAILSILHHPFDHRMYGQNLTVQNFFNASVPAAVQATFPYTFVVSILQHGACDLVGYMVYEIAQHPYQNVFYNSIIKVEAGGLLSADSVFHITFTIAINGLLGLWVYGKLQRLSKDYESSVSTSEKHSEAMEKRFVRIAQVQATMINQLESWIAKVQKVINQLESEKVQKEAEVQCRDPVFTTGT